MLALRSGSLLLPGHLRSLLLRPCHGPGLSLGPRLYLPLFLHLTLLHLSLLLHLTLLNLALLLLLPNLLLHLHLPLLLHLLLHLPLRLD